MNATVPTYLECLAAARAEEAAEAAYLSNPTRENHLAFDAARDNHHKMAAAYFAAQRENEQAAAEAPKPLATAPIKTALAPHATDPLIIAELQALAPTSREQLAPLAARLHATYKLVDGSGQPYLGITEADWLEELHLQANKHSLYVKEEASPTKIPFTWGPLLERMLSEIKAAAPTCFDDLRPLAERLNREIAYDSWQEELDIQAQTHGLYVEPEENHGPEFESYGYDYRELYCPHCSGGGYWRNEAGEYCYG